MPSKAELEIIGQSRSGYLRKQRESTSFESIKEFFLPDEVLQLKRVLDLGPGHYQFAELARNLGAMVTVIEHDAALAELGRHKNFNVLEGDIKNSGALLQSEKYHGVFCKFSFSAYWFTTRSAQFGFAKSVRNAIEDGGWAWLAPWNGGLRMTSENGSDPLEWQREAFESVGFSSVELSLAESKRFGVHGFTGNRVLFTFGLDYSQLEKSGLRAVSSPESIAQTLVETSSHVQSTKRNRPAALVPGSNSALSKLRELVKKLRS
jgi:hypothetical protein